MTAITVATRIKPTPSAKVGLSFAATKDGRIVITKVQDKGLFAGSGIESGQELLTINGVSIRGMPVKEVAMTLACIPREVTVQAGPEEQKSLLKCDIIVKRRQDANIDTQTLRGLEEARSAPEPVEQVCFHTQHYQLPNFLKSQGVSAAKWSRIVTSFRDELVPALQHSLNMERVLRNEMKVYKNKQMVKGQIGFGLESQHEKKVYMMTHQAAIQHSNLALVASNLISKANALLNGHGVLAELSFTQKTLPKYSHTKESNTIGLPCAILFTPIDDEGDVSAPPMPLATTVVPIQDSEEFA